MRRFFVDPCSIIENTAYLSPAESQHIVAVLRLNPGDQIELFDGTGSIYRGELRELSRDQVTVLLLARERGPEEKAPALCLMQSLLKGKKMDFLVQKATELGVHTFQPVLTRYSEIRGNPDRQWERWQRIMLEACKQCRRPVPMRISHPADFRQLTIESCSTRLLLWEDEQQQGIGPHVLGGRHSVCLLVGPEGGFHREEVRAARDRGFQAVTLGRRTLRAETASLAAVAVIQYLLGTLGKEQAI